MSDSSSENETDIPLTGLAPRIQESTQEAKDTYYGVTTHHFSHIVSLWLMEEHEDPVGSLLMPSTQQEEKRLV